MQLLVEVWMNSLYGEEKRKDFEAKYAYTSLYWIPIEYDERILVFWKVSHGNLIVKLVEDEKLEDEVEKLNTMPLRLDAFVLSDTKGSMKNSIHNTIAFETNDSY